MRYRLRTLLIALLGLAIAFSFVGMWWRKNSLERYSVRLLVGLGASVDYSDQFNSTDGLDKVEPPSAWELWVDSRIGREYRSDVIVVFIPADQALQPDVILALKQLPGLQVVSIVSHHNSIAMARSIVEELRIALPGVRIDVAATF